MIEEQEWLFFEATEQRIKTWTSRHNQNLLAFWSGAEPPHNPADLLEKRTLILQEMDYPERLETALRDEDISTEKRRRLELHQLWMVETAFRTHPDMSPLEDEIRLEMAKFKPLLGDRPSTWSQIEHLLRSESDRELREAAWKAHESLARVLEPKMAELLGLREAWAQSLAGTGFAPVAYHVQQMERTLVVNLLDEVERTTRGVMPQIMDSLAKAAEVPDIEPWDYFYGLNQLFALSAAAFPEDVLVEAAELQSRRWGWEPSDLNLTLVQGDHPGRARVLGGPEGVTILSRAGSGPWSFDRLFRAYGQGIHRLLAGGGRFFLETPSAPQAEATGAFFAHVLTDPHWLDEHTGAGAKTIDAAIDHLRSYYLIKTRFHLAHNIFENVAYTHARVEPTRMFQDVLEQVFQGTRQQSVAWAAMGAYLETPLSFASPVLGNILGAQLWNTFEGSHEEVWRSEAVGQIMLEEWIQPGAKEPWTEAINRVTTTPMNLEGFRKWYKLNTFDGPSLEEAESVSDADAEAYFEGIDLSDLD